MRIYCFSGLGADQRVFQYLEIVAEYTLVPVAWIDPKPNESIEQYAARIAKNIKDQEPFGIMGLSFGGVIAQEVAKILHPAFTFIISTIEEKKQIPFMLKWTPNWMLDHAPKQLFNPPKSIANYLFSTKQKALLAAILDDTDPAFVKWALKALKNWKAEGEFGPINAMCGDKDRLFKPYGESVVVQGGGHLMVVDRAEEVSKVINDWLRQYSAH